MPDDVLYGPSIAKRQTGENWLSVDNVAGVFSIEFKNTKEPRGPYMKYMRSNKAKLKYKLKIKGFYGRALAQIRRRSLYHYPV